MRVIFSIFKMLQDSLFFCRGSGNNMISVLMIVIIMIMIMIRKKESASYLNERTSQPRIEPARAGTPH